MFGIKRGQTLHCAELSGTESPRSGREERLPHKVSWQTDLLGSPDDHARQVHSSAGRRLHPERNPRGRVASLAWLQGQQIEQLSLVRSNRDERPLNETRT